MKKNLAVFVLALSCIAVLAAQTSPTWAEQPRYDLTVAIQGGAFNYVTTDGPPVYSSVDPMVELGAVFEYHLVEDVGLGGYFQFRSYRWDTITSADPLIAQIMGAPGFAIGLMAFWHFLAPESHFDLCLAGGFGCNFYFNDPRQVFPGIDITSELTGLYRFSRRLSAGLRICLRHSIHEGGAQPYTGPGDLRPFNINEINAGMAVKFSF